MSTPLYTVKSADHRHDRIEERTPFSKSNVDSIQKSVDLMNLKPGSYHLPLRDKNGDIAGYAVFKGVKDRKTPVLATVYHRHMKPPGVDIEATLRKAAALETNQKSTKDAIGETMNLFNIRKEFGEFPPLLNES